MGLKREVINIIQSHDACHPVHGSSIVTATGLKSDTELRSIVNEARCLGIPVASSRDGYWWGGDSTGIMSTVAELRGRANQIMGAVDGLTAGWDGTFCSSFY